MAIKKFINLTLHSTRGSKHRPKLGLTGRKVSGEGFSKKANMKYRFINYNQEGKTNIITWL